MITFDNDTRYIHICSSSKHLIQYLNDKGITPSGSTMIFDETSKSDLLYKTTTELFTAIYSYGVEVGYNAGYQHYLNEYRKHKESQKKHSN